MEESIELSREAPKKRPGPQTKTRETILTLIREAEEFGCTVKQLITATGLSKSSVFEHVNNLTAAGLVRKLYLRSSLRFRLVDAMAEVKSYDGGGNGPSHIHYYAPYYREGKHCMKCDNLKRRKLSAAARKFISGTVKYDGTVRRAHIARRPK